MADVDPEGIPATTVFQSSCLSLRKVQKKVSIVKDFMEGS
jgi:hypothetical protein